MSVPKVLYLQHGGKTTIAKWVVEHFPPHRVYVEPFFGGGAVLLRKPRSPVEIANDADRSIVNVYRQAIEQPEALAAMLRVCPYHEGHDWSMDEDTLAAAVQAVAEAKQKYVGSRSSSAWRSGAGGGCTKSWAAWWKRVAPLVSRVSGVTFFCRDACDVIERYAGEPDALFYVDPPYVGHEKEYRQGVDYARLVDVCSRVAGSVVVSEYPEALGAWPQHWCYEERECVKRSGKSATGKNGRKREVLILNPRAEAYLEGSDT